MPRMTLTLMNGLTARDHRATCHVYQTLYEVLFIYKLECGPMPNVMVALPNIGGARCSTPQSLADAHY